MKIIKYIYQSTDELKQLFVQIMSDLAYTGA
jgi:hypothetical protein